MTISTTILEQLGGNRFALLTGAKNFMGTDRALHFTVGSGARQGINRVKVILDDDDTYTVEFCRVHAGKVKTIKMESDIYADMLQDRFTAATGFYTSF